MKWQWFAGCAVLSFLGLSAASCGEPTSDGDEADRCDAGRTLCSGSCVSLQDDPAHCGACGQACGAGRSCVAGACACLTGLAACDTSCVDLETDGANCGQCGLICAAPLVCSLGQCSEACAEGLDQCGASCTDLTTDVANCGACAKACPGGACVGGQCSPLGTSAKICDEPEPWPTPATTRIVGDGTAASCTEQALRQAVSEGGLVRFECGEEPVTISIASAVEVGQETVVDGEGKITLDGGGTSQIFLVHDKLSVRSLRFVNGKAPASTDADGIGGAVAGGWRSSVEVIRCTFEDNTAGRGGGAVAVWTGSSLTIVASQFRRNRSWYGGAVYSLWSPLTIVNSEFTDNVTLDDGDGGAIGTDGALDPDLRTETVGGKVEICGTRIRNNEGNGTGGGAYLWVYPPDKVLIDRCIVDGNEAAADSGGGSLGGGMRISNGEITVMRSSFLSNRAASHGGGLYLDCAPGCTITNTTLFGNEAGPADASTAAYGGAIFGDGFRLNNVTVAQNFASGHGGALFGGENWVIENTLFLDNTAGNPWNQANNCSATGTGANVLQWLSTSGDAGGDRCIPEVIAADPLLAAPADNGGPTLTLLPDAVSPALQAGTNCESVDQRGHPRDTNACDLGSVELP